MDKKTFRTLEYNKILDQLANFTTSSLGREKVYTLEPSIDIQQIRVMQQETSEAVSMILRKGSAPIAGLRDIRNAMKRTEIGAVLNLKELLDIAHALGIARNIKKYAGEDEFPLLNCMIEQLQVLKKLEDNIIFCILSEEEVSDQASPELSNIRKKIGQIQNRIKDYLNDIIHSSKYQMYLQEPIVTVRGDRYVVPVKAEHKGSVSGIVHDSSSSGATLFIEPMAVVEANNQLRQLRSQEQKEIERILAELTNMVAEHLDEIRNNVEIIATLDFIFAKAKLSLEMNGVEPVMNTRGYVNIKKGRHPLLDPRSVVPTDIYLGKDFDILVITGPNTGGKTVTLKTIGLFTLMGQSGLHISANEGTELAVFEKVFADIGDEQSIEQSLSTFSSHMTNIVKILKKTDERSLVLLDELGAGTDPIEGAALAMAILEYLHQIGARAAATTHYSELKLFALSTKGVENASCEFDINTLRPTYKLLIGVPGKSNAFAISSRLGLGYDIIDRAKQFVSQEDVKFEDVISNLEKDRQIAEREKENVLRYKQEVEQLRNELRQSKEKFKLQKVDLLNEARREARKIIQQAKLEADEVIRELKQLEEQRELAERNKAIEQAKRRLNDRTDELDEALAGSILPRESYIKPPKNLKPGDAVAIISLNQKGNVLSPPDDNGEVLLQVGIMKVNVHISNLKKIEDAAVSYTNKTGAGKISLAKTAQMTSEIDLRGNILEDAMLITDKYLDDAALAGLKQVTIIHGKGTGVLRTGIHQMLKQHHHVQTFRLGKYGEGESGVTLVELK